MRLFANEITGNTIDYAELAKKRVIKDREFNINDIIIAALPNTHPLKNDNSNNYNKYDIRIFYFDETRYDPETCAPYNTQTIYNDVKSRNVFNKTRFIKHVYENRTKTKYFAAVTPSINFTDIDLYDNLEQATVYVPIILGNGLKTTNEVINSLGWTEALFPRNTNIVYPLSEYEKVFNLLRKQRLYFLSTGESIQNSFIVKEDKKKYASIIIPITQCQTFFNNAFTRRMSENSEIYGRMYIYKIAQYSKQRSSDIYPFTEEIFRNDIYMFAYKTDIIDNAAYEKYSSIISNFNNLSRESFDEDYGLSRLYYALAHNEAALNDCIYLMFEESVESATIDSENYENTSSAEIGDSDSFRYTETNPDP